jgi:hypothetical protein
MTTSTIQFITHTKLAELSRQRESLLAQYQSVETAGQGDDLLSLASFYKALREVRITEFPLHRELANLQALLQNKVAPQSLIDYWREKLRLEVTRGRLRANIVYLFGAFLSEWESNSSEVHQRRQERHTRKSEMLDSLAANQPAPSLKSLNSVVSQFNHHHEKVRAKTQEKLDKSLALKLGRCSRLNLIAENPHHLSEVRAEAKRFLEDHTLERQFSEAIQVATRDPRLWAWPQAGVPARVLWTRNRWRLYPTLSLVDLTTISCCSDFWSSAIDDCYTSAAQMLARRGRLQSLIDLNAPEVIMANEKRMLSMEKEKVLIKWYEPVDPWTQEPVLADDENAPVGGIVSARANQQAELRDCGRLGYGYADGINPMVRLVSAEIELLRAAFPDRPLHLVKFDIRDYFASVPHETLLAMLAGLGETDDGIDFARRFLRTPYQRSDQTTFEAQRGVPMDQQYSHWLCEWLLRLLEQFIHENTSVRIIRQVDDVCLLAANAEDAVAGFRAARKFVSDIGLEFNADKCGAVTIGAAKSQELPTANPKWGVLELNGDGQWQTSAESFAVYLADSQREVESRHPILAKVLAYNEQLKYLVSSLGLAMDLGDYHRASVASALQAFENDFFGPGQSVFDGLRSCIDARYQGELQELPLSWMVWPITAGGLGLRSATVLCGQYEIAYERRAKVRKPAPDQRTDRWQNETNEWKEFYEDKEVTLEPATCGESATMEGLVERFIVRGKKISGGKQKGLAPYWRWTLSIFGPEILDRLGTFEFLLTELVPLQLIQDKLLSADSAD